MPVCHATSAGPMLQSEEGWTLSQRLDSPGRKGLDNGPTIRPLSRKEQHTKAGTPTLQDARLLCNKHMAYTAVGGRISAEPAIGLSRSKGGWIQKRASWLCRMPNCYATSAWSMLRSEGVWTLDLRLDFSVRRIWIQKRVSWLCRVPVCHATSAWPMLQSEGVWTLSQRLGSPGRKGLDTEPAIRLSDRKDSIQNQAL